MCDLVLVEPAKEHEALALAYRQDYLCHGEDHINGSGGLLRYADYEEWLQHLSQLKQLKASRFETPATTWFTIRPSDGKIIGTIQLRHHLTDELKRDGGNIGYGICPSERRRGYGRRQLALVLGEARGLGLERVMITCNRGNLGSAQVAKSNGGIYGGEGFDEEEGTATEIYWIELN